MTKRKWHLVQRRRSNSTLGFLFPVLSSHRLSSFDLVLFLSFSLSLFVFFRPTLVTRAPRLRFEHERELGWENASCPWSPRNRNDCNLHKLSFHFDDDVTEAPKAEKRGIVNDREDRILYILYFRSSWYNMEFPARKIRSHSTLFTSYSDYLCDTSKVKVK